MTEDARVVMRRAIRAEQWELAAWAMVVTVVEAVRDVGPAAAEALVDELALEAVREIDRIPAKRRRGRCRGRR